MSQATIMLSTSDYVLLQSLLLPRGREWELLGTMLRRKLHDAVVAFPADIDPEYVRIGSRIRFSTATGREERVLVVDAAQPPGSRELPLRSTRGLALLGARAGETLCVPVQNGGIETLQVLEVAQPDTAPGAAPPPVRQTATAGAAGDRVVPFLPRPARPVQAIEPGDDPGPSAA